MQLLTNIALGALLAAVSLGPPAWAESVEAGGRLLHVASRLAGAGDEGSPLAHAEARARAALPDLPRGAH